MGNVAYAVDKSQLTNPYSAESDLISCGIEIEVPIGDVSMAISREALEYTPKTKANVNKAVGEALEELSKKFTHLKTTFGKLDNKFPNFRL